MFWTDKDGDKIYIDVDEDFENALQALEAMDLSTRRLGARSVPPIYKLHVLGEYQRFDYKFQIN